METASDTNLQEKLARIEKLRTSESVVISGNEIEANSDIKIYRENAKKYGLSLRNIYRNKDRNCLIYLSKGSIKEVISHNISEEQLKSVAAIPKIIENAIYLHSIENEDKEKHPDVQYYEYYVCGLRINKIEYTVKAVVANSTTGKRYYDHLLTSIEKGRLISLTAAISHHGNETNLPNSGVKDKRLLRILQESLEK